jgi:hypothetical protein
MDANAIGFADVFADILAIALAIWLQRQTASSFRGPQRAVTRQGSETTSGRIRPLHEIVRGRRCRRVIANARKLGAQRLGSLRVL